MGAPVSDTKSQRATTAGRADELLGRALGGVLRAMCWVFASLAAAMGVGAWISGHTGVAVLCGGLGVAAIWLAAFLKRHRSKLSDYDLS